MMDVDVNWLAVAGGTVASMASGAFWYSPKVFGTKWMKAIALTEKQLSEGQMKSMVIAMVRSFLLAFSLFHIIYVSAEFYSADSFLQNAASTGLWVGIVIVALTMLMHDTFEQRPSSGINVSYEIFNILLVATVIGLIAG